MKTSGNTILITGGGSGIGRALAWRLHDRGDTVIVAGRRQEALDETIADRPRMFAHILDVDDGEKLAAFARTVVEAHPTLNVLVNNAGVMRLEALDGARNLSDAQETIVTNLLGPIRLIDAFIDHLIGQPDAVIANVSSGLAFVPLVRAPTYSATKAAIHSYTVSLRRQLTGRVEVLEIAPPGVQTDLTPGQSTRDGYMPLDDYADQVVAQLTAQPTPEEILVERSRMLRQAEANGRFADALATVNGG